MSVIDQAEEYLRFIDSTDRIKCLKVFSILKGQFGDSGFGLANDWASQAHNHDPKWVNDNWRSAESSLFGFPVLHLMGKDGGLDSPYRIVNTVKPVQCTSNSGQKIRYANSIWAHANTDDEYVGLHPYSVKKEINWAAGAGRGTISGSRIGENSDCLIIPIYDLQTDSLQGVQCINPEGIKQSFGCVKGGALILGNNLRHDATWAMAEGWASAVSCVHWLGYDCAVCSFGKNRFDEVFHLTSKRFAPTKIQVMGETDD